MILNTKFTTIFFVTGIYINGINWYKPVCIDVQIRIFTWHCFSGYSDPFVKVRLLPKDKFVHAIKPSTSVQKKTLYPLFDECFKMLVLCYLTNEFVI